MKWASLFHLLIITLALICASAFGAKANPPLYEDLVCSQTEPAFLIRFAAGEYPDSNVASHPASPPKFIALPASVDGGLSKTAPAQKTECRLPDEHQVRIRTGEGQELPYINTESSAFFSLWIDKRKVLSQKEWKPGYGEQDYKPWLVAVVYRRGLLTFCSSNQDGKLPECKGERIDLSSMSVDLDEYPLPGMKLPEVGSIQILPQAHHPELCQEFLRDNPGILKDPPLSLMVLNQRAISFETQQANDIFEVGTANLSVGGADYKFIWREGITSLFDGDIVLVAPASTPTKRLVGFMQAVDYQWDKAKLPQDWTLIMGGLADIYPKANARFIHLRDFRLGGRLYFAAFPSNADLNKPTVTLVSLTDKLKIEAVCSMQIVEPHF